MASSKLQNLTATTTLADTDVLYSVVDPGGTPLDRKITKANFKTALSLVKADVGLGNVDNTSDVNKPVSTATQTALDLKANLASPTFTGTVGGITAAMVGAPSGSGTSSGTNTGDNAANTTYASDYRAVNFVAGTNYLAPTGSAAGLTSFPTLNQNTTGSAATLTTPRTIGGVSFNGSANTTVASATGGFAVSGGNLTLGTNKITGVGDPTATQDAATKNYVDTVAQGLSAKTSAILASTAALPSNTYNNGASGVGATLTGVATGVLTIDSITVALNDRLLIKDEATGANNGIYVCTVAGAIGVAYVLTRSTDMDINTEFPGGFVFIESGTVNSASGWVCTNNTPPTIGTTAITFTQFSGAGQIIAGNGLSKSGNTLSIDTSITVDKNTAQTLTNKTLTSPIISSISNTGTLTLPTSTDTLVGKATTDILTNKNLTSGTNTFPTLNQNTTGSASSLSISGQTGLMTVTGLTTVNRVKTVRDAADTILELGGSYTPTGTWTSMTLVTPALGTPSALVGTNITGTAAS